jgi:hydroxylysine kinase
MSDDEARRKAEKPVCSAEAAIKIVKELFGLTVEVGKVKELESYDDRNFYVCGTIDGSKEVNEYTIKVHNGVESDNSVILEAQNAILTKLSDAGFSVPTPTPTSASELIAYTELPLKQTGKPKRHAVRLLAWVKGKMLSDIECDACLLFNAGTYLGNLSSALDGFDHPGAHRFHQWDLNQTGSLVDFVQHISDSSKREVVMGVINEWGKQVSTVHESRCGVWCVAGAVYGV